MTFLRKVVITVVINFFFAKVAVPVAITKKEPNSGILYKLLLLYVFSLVKKVTYVSTFFSVYVFNRIENENLCTNYFAKWETLF